MHLVCAFQNLNKCVHVCAWAFCNDRLCWMGWGERCDEVKNAEARFCMPGCVEKEIGTMNGLHEKAVS